MSFRGPGKNCHQWVMVRFRPAGALGVDHEVEMDEPHAVDLHAPDGAMRALCGPLQWPLGALGRGSGHCCHRGGPDSAARIDCSAMPIRGECLCLQHGLEFQSAKTAFDASRTLSRGWVLIFSAG